MTYFKVECFFIFGIEKCELSKKIFSIKGYFFMFMTNFNVVGQQMADNKGPVGLMTGGSNIIMNSILVEVFRSTFILFVSHQTSQKILQQNAYVSCMVNPERQIHNKILCIQYLCKSSERLIGEVIQTRWSNELVNQIRWSNKLVNQDGQIELV